MVILKYQLLHTLKLDVEGDFVTGYADSIGDFSFLRGGSDFVNTFVSNLRANIEFDPSNEDEDGEDQGTNGGFNIRRFLRNMVSRFEDTAVEEFSQQSAELEQCIRQVIEVSSFKFTIASVLSNIPTHA